MTVSLPAQLLSRENFAAFGDLIETEGATHYTINAGWAERFHDLAKLDLTAQSGQPTVSIFRSKPRCMSMMTTAVRSGSTSIGSGSAPISRLRMVVRLPECFVSGMNRLWLVAHHKMYTRTEARFRPRWMGFPDIQKLN